MGSKHKTLYEWCKENNNVQLLNEWNEEMNKISPKEIGHMSHKYVWWKCSKGHEWESIVSNRTNLGRNCPICSNQRILKGYNDLSTINPSLAKEWNYERNAYEPTSIGAYSKKIVWWKCSKGHEWRAEIKSRNYGIGCPYCSNKRVLEGFNDLNSKYPKIAKEWDYEKNGNLKPTDCTFGSGKSVWWICKNGHHYKSPLYVRKSGSGCPYCAKNSRTSFGEQCVFYYVHNIYNDAINSYKDIFNKMMELDIYIPSIKVGIEYDGILYHNKAKNIERDSRKYSICKKNGIKLIRIKEISDETKSNKIEDYKIEINNGRDVNELNTAINELLRYLGKETKVNVENDKYEILSNLDKRRANLYESFPNIAKEWNYEKNFPLVPQNVAPHSNVKVWWKCSKCGNEWQSLINNRVGNRRGCPYCSHQKIKEGTIDIKTLRPDLANEWNYEKNYPLTPNTVSIHSNKKVWWKCSRCGNEFQSIINNRTKEKSIFCHKCKMEIKSSTKKL